MDFPPELKYTREHEWVMIENDEVAIGITEYASDQLGDIVFVELPEIGDEVGKDEALGTIESVKAVSDLYSPVSGKIIDANAELDKSPEIVNEDAYGDGWMVRIKIEDPTELDDLMDAKAYDNFVAEEMESDENEEDGEEDMNDFEDES